MALYIISKVQKVKLRTRWLKTSRYVIYKKGHLHSNSDALSRVYVPCRQCGRVRDEDTDSSTAPTTITESAGCDIK